MSKAIQIKFRFNKTRIIYTLFLAVVVMTACRKSVGDDIAGFQLSSPEIKADSLLPMDYTCDGVSATLPLSWSGEPDGTVAFAMVMHHVASPEDIHWYWVLYNIPANVHTLARNDSVTGIHGTNSVNDRNEYTPPCSQGPGIKAYTYTIYALSSNPVFSATPLKVTRQVLLDAMANITLSSAKMTVYYSRTPI